MDLQPKLTGSGKLKLPGTFCITDTLAPVTDGFLRRAKGSRTYFYFDSTREPDAGPAGSGVHCRPLEKAKHIISTGVGDRPSGAPSPRPLTRSSRSALSVPLSVQTTRLRGVRLAPLTAGPAAPTRRRPALRSPHGEAVERRGPRCARAAAAPRAARGRGQSHGRRRGHLPGL